MGLKVSRIFWLKNGTMEGQELRRMPLLQIQLYNYLVYSGREQVQQIIIIFNTPNNIGGQF
jgi:hypothetical protein